MITTINEFRKTINEGLFETDKKVKPYEKLYITAIINFLKEEWDFDATISIRRQESNKYLGYIQLNDNSINKNKFILHFNPNQSYNMILNTILHEVTHIKQVAKKELNVKTDWKSIIWENDFELSVKEYNKICKNLTEYNKLPWELEARENQNNIILKDKLFNSKYWLDLKGKDTNLDFILDNI